MQAVFTVGDSLLTATIPLLRFLAFYGRANFPFFLHAQKKKKNLRKVTLKEGDE